MKRTFTVILHPAAILKQNRYGMEPAQVEYLRRLREFPSWRPTPLTVSPGYCLDPSVADLVTFGEWLREQPDPTTFPDIECAGAHLICVGIRHSSGRGVCCRFRRRGGRLYWPSRAALEQATQWLDNYLCNPSLPKVFHNGQAFDIPYLETVGFGPVQGYVGDTLLLARYLYPEMPADLQFVAGLYAGYQPWKHLSKLEGEESGK